MYNINVVMLRCKQPRRQKRLVCVCLFVLDDYLLEPGDRTMRCGDLEEMNNVGRRG